MKRYSLGFIFDISRSRVLLVHKNKPDWQAGKVNGIGGKIKPGETSLDCIVRETAEESALRIDASQWCRLGEMYGANWHSDVFCAIYSGSLNDAHRADHEEIEWFPIDALPANTITNLHWLIPLALNMTGISEKAMSQFSVRYTD